MQDSCKKSPPCACGVENPGVNLVWLKNLLENKFCVDIYKYSFDGTEYIVVSTCSAASDRIESVYTCEGTWQCTHGGKWPNPCQLSATFWDNYYSKRELVYQIINP